MTFERNTAQEYYEFWIQEANVQAKRLDLPPAFLNEAYGIFTNALGPEWIIGELSRRPRITVPFPNIHSMAGWIETPGPYQVCSLIETALYFKHLLSCRRFDAVLEMLKSDQFKSSFLQLAFAYRFQKLGVTELEFEPDVAGGRKADLSFSFGGLTYLAECYAPGHDQYQPYFDLLRYSPNKLFEHSRYFAKRTITYLDVLELPKPGSSLRKDVEREAKRLIESVTAQSPVSRDTPAYRLQVIDTTQLDDKDELELFLKYYERSSCGVSSSSISKSDMERVVRGERVPKKAGSRLILQLPSRDVPLEDSIGTLAEKIEQKVAQLRPPSGSAKGLIIVQSALGRPQGREHRKLLERLQGKVFTGHPNVVGLILTDRVQDEIDRPYFVGHLFTGPVKDEATQKLLDKLNDLEHQTFPWTTI
jgi:hypothetical protein